MKPIDSQFTKDGWDHTLVERTGLVAIFERSKNEGRQLHWETVLLRETKANTATFGERTVEYPAQEKYPTSEDWGTRGWTYNSLAESRLKASALLAATPQTHP